MLMWCVRRPGRYFKPGFLSQIPRDCLWDACTQSILSYGLCMRRTGCFRRRCRLRLDRLTVTQWLVFGGLVPSIVPREQIGPHKGLATVRKLACIDLFWVVIELVAMEMLCTSIHESALAYTLSSRYKSLTNSVYHILHAGTRNLGVM